MLFVLRLVRRQYCCRGLEIIFYFTCSPSELLIKSPLQTVDPSICKWNISFGCASNKSRLSQASLCGEHGLELPWRRHWLETQLCSVLIYWSWFGLPEGLIPWSFSGILRELFSALYSCMGRERAGHCRLVFHQTPVRLDVVLVVWQRSQEEMVIACQLPKETKRSVSLQNSFPTERVEVASQSVNLTKHS